jgi:hypothetical protein
LAIFFVGLGSCSFSYGDDAAGDMEFPETRIDLVRSMNLAGQNLLNMLHPGHDYLPSFLIAVEPDYTADRQVFFAAHNIGRWLDAMYRLEAATGFTAPEKIQAAMLRNVQAYCNNPDNLFLRPLDRYPFEKGDLFCFHSLREHLAALHALAKYKGSGWARERASQMIIAFDQLLLPEQEWRVQGTVWDIPKLKRYQAQNCKEVFWGWSPNLQGSEGRLIEPLLWIYDLTGDTRALKLAGRFAQFHLDLSTRPDGAFYAEKLSGHNHSYMGTLRGLLYYGRVTDQHQYVEAVAQTYDNAVKKIVRHSGFTTHDLQRDYGGDLSSAADAAQIALWLGCDCGYPEHLDDVQRLVISRILAAQITECPPLRPKDVDRQAHTKVMPDSRFAWVDYPENMAEMVIGALGGIYGRPHGGKWSVTDVTCSVLSFLVDFYQSIAREGARDVWVYFHMDYDTEFLKIGVQRGKVARVSIDLRTNKNLLVRIPDWVPRKSLVLTVNGMPGALDWMGSFVVVSKNQFPGVVELRYELPFRKEKEKIGDVEFEISWRGDEVVGICPNTDFYPFYPTAKDCK